MRLEPRSTELPTTAPSPAAMPRANNSASRKNSGKGLAGVSCGSLVETGIDKVLHYSYIRLHYSKDRYLIP